MKTLATVFGTFVCYGTVLAQQPSEESKDLQLDDQVNMREVTMQPAFRAAITTSPESAQTVTDASKRLPVVLLALAGLFALGVSVRFLVPR